MITRLLFCFFILLQYNQLTFGQNTIAFTNLVQVCENDTLVFKDNSTLAGGATIVEYAWDFDGDAVYDSIVAYDTITHAYNATDLQQNYAGQHSFNVTLRVVTSLGDTFYSAPKVITINYLPVLLSGANPPFKPEVCKLDELYFFNNFYVTEGIINNTYWYFNDEDETYTQNYFSRTFTTAETLTVKTTAFSNKGCRTTVYATLKVKEIPNGELSYSGATTFYNDKSVDITVAGDFSSVLWNNNATTPKITVDTTGVYVVTLTNDEGCKIDLTSEQITVMEEQPIDAMNVLTLNDDGKNDVWKIYDIEAYGTCQVSIFNRNGILVYESKDYQNTWNGKDDAGNKLAEGAYYYTIIASELEETKRGVINILY